MNIALIIAGGSGERMHQDIPKQFLNVNDKPVIVYTLEAFQKHPSIDAIVVVCLEGWQEILRAYSRQFGINKLESVVTGGINGQASILAGISDISKRHSEDDIVLIHDAIRPMVTEEIISDCISVCTKYGNAISVIPCAEAVLKTVDGNTSVEQVQRDGLKRTQTPQAASLGVLMRAHDEAKKRGITNSIATCTLLTELGIKVHFSLGSEKNIKLTTVEDIDIFKALLISKRSEWMK
jgi:2-C-methyl-D-erythritol 4-phosphate cytidylyltransferase